MIKALDFNKYHIDKAKEIALMNYNEERMNVKELPQIEKVPDLKYFADNGLGTAIFDDNEMLGFFCWFSPWDNHFGFQKGTWSPTHAHGSIKRNRADIYDRLYQAAAKKLVSANILSHSVTLYEHDKEANESFFLNGFGRRCVDAIRMTTPISLPPCDGVTFRQANENDAEVITNMRNYTSIHLSQSPMFMPFSDPDTITDTVNEIRSKERQYFIAYMHDSPIAYYSIQKNGENFVCDTSDMMNITGAFVLQKFRGKGVAVGFLSWLMNWLREQGYSYCGVDFECFNFTGRKFWLKYFTAYTNGVVRRIDERINNVH